MHANYSGANGRPNPKGERFAMQLTQLIRKKPPEESGQAAPVKRRKRKLPFVLGGAVILAVFLFLNGAKKQEAELSLALTDTVVLAAEDLQSTVSATGTVESAQSMTVYSTMAYTVQEVCVEVGDYVEEGELLCRLDDKNIQKQIESQEASLGVAGGTSAASVNAARDSYEQFKASLDQGLNASILSAESAVTNAYNSYTNAVNTYERYKEGLEAGENATLLGQESGVRSARVALENAQEGYINAVDALDDAREAVRDAQADLDDARDDLRDAEDDLDDAEDDLDRAERQLDRLSDPSASVTRLQREIAALEAQISAAEEGTDLTELTAQLTAKQGELAAAQSAAASYQASYQSLAQEVASLTSKAAQLEASVAQAESKVKSYESTLKQAENAVESCQKQITTAQRNVSNAQESYTAAVTQYNASATTVDNALTDYATAVETAYEAYQTAQTNLEAAKVSAQNQLQSYADNLKSAQAGANKATGEVSLRQLRADLADTEIKAPCAGTITAVYAEVGSAGSGLLFVIEDVKNLVVSTSVKDYDVGSVRTGMAVAIKSDSTGDKVYDGEISSIAPTADKTPQGATAAASGDVSFATDVKVLSQDTPLRIGMSVRLSFILDEAKAALTVPYEAVYINEEGENCLLAAEEQEDGTYLLREYTVNTGIENDLDIVVQGTGLREGLRVISEPDRYLSMLGMAVPAGSGPARANPYAAMMGGMA